MNPKPNIDQLLSKYWDGKTKLYEEQILHTYFASDDVRLEHLNDRAIFNSFQVRSQRTMPAKFNADYWSQKASAIPQKKAKVWNLHRWSIAASFALLIGVGGYMVQEQWNDTDVSTVATAKEAVVESEKALLFLAEQFGIGEKATSQVLHLKTLGNTLQ